MDDDEFDFVIEGPDADGFVWICSPRGRDVWCRNLGLAADVEEKLSDWLGQRDYQERG